MKKSHGFTLIEMSVVIIIIGLIIAGITKGKDLIESSKINATIAQITQYETATNSFQSKYGWLPGDFNKASIFIDSSLSDGNRDSRILGGTAADSITFNNGEPLEFWNHLSKANMIQEPITQLDPSVNVTAATLGVHFPKTKLNKGGIAVKTSGKVNTWYIGTQDSYIYGYENSMSPHQAYSIDTKLDDGMPGEGEIFLSIYFHTNKYISSSHLPVAYRQVTTCTEVGNGDDNVDPGENYNPNGTSNSCALIKKAGF